MPNVQGSGSGQQLSYAPIALRPDDGDLTDVAKYEAAETTRLSGSFDEVQVSEAGSRVTKGGYRRKALRLLNTRTPFLDSQDDAEVVGPSKAAVGYWKALKRDSWLLPLAHTEFWMSAAFSLIQPFYPILASSRGIEAWKYGFVFSFFKVFMLIGSIAAEKLINRITPMACYLFGQGGFFIFTVLFGFEQRVPSLRRKESSCVISAPHSVRERYRSPRRFNEVRSCLYWAPGGNVLLGLSMACVVLGGITNTFYLVSKFAVFTTRFPKHKGGIIACLEFLWGSGNMAGSAIGGALMDAWAYPLPYFVLGAITMLSFPVVVKFRSKLNQCNEAEECEDVPEQEGNIRSYYWLLTDPIFFADMITLTMSWIILGFNEPTLEPSLENFNLTRTVLGSIYTVQFSSYSIGGFIAGTFSHYSLEPFYAMMGQLFTIVAYLVIGPAPFLPVSRTLALVYISQVFTGLGMSTQFICGYCHALKRAVQRGYPDNIRTNGFISSIVFTFAVFGAMVTPPIAGYFVELYGYRRGSMLMFGLLVAWAPATIVLWVHSIRSGRKEVRVRHYLSRTPNQLAMS